MSMDTFFWKWYFGKKKIQNIEKHENFNQTWNDHFVYETECLITYLDWKDHFERKFMRFYKIL